MHNQTLDFDSNIFKALLEKTSELVLDRFSNLDSQKGFHSYPQKEVESWFDEALPQTSMDSFHLLDQVKKDVLDTATGNLGPNMYAYVMTGGTQMSILAEMLATTINQNVAKWHLSPALSEMEKRVAQWGAEMIGFDAQGAGVMVSGGSAANLTGLTVARNIFCEKEAVRKKGLYGMAPLIVYASQEVHGCIDKSMELLGLGTNYLRKVATKADFTIDVEALEAQIIQDKQAGYTPFCIIGNAGTVNTGAIDDLHALANLASKYELWFHVDGAYGGLAAMLDSVRELYSGIDRADSVAIDFHKWLYQPYEAGCLLVKEWSTLKKAYFKQADYLDTSLEGESSRLDFNSHYFQLSRNSKALKIWMSIKAYGMEKIRSMIQKDIDLAAYLSNQVEASADFELCTRSELGISCFRYIGNLKSEAEIVALNKALIPALEKDGRVFITGTLLNGKFVIRACLINHRKQRSTTDYLLQVIREVAIQVQNQQGQQLITGV